MNKKEYYSANHRNKYHKYVHKVLREWAHANNITVPVLVHHRDDTDECRKYNDEHYELWGCEEDGTFEYGKYVVFMTTADHAAYHHTGKTRSDTTRKKMCDNHADFKGSNNPNYGKHRTEETKDKIRKANTGHKHSAEVRQKISENRKGKCVGEDNHNFGKELSDDVKHKISFSRKGKLKGSDNPFYGKVHDEYTLAVIRDKCTARIRYVREMYNKYKESGGQLKWNDFRKAFSSGALQTEEALNMNEPC